MSYPHAAFSGELSRISSEYEKRDSTEEHAGRYGLFNEAALLHAHSLEHHMLATLKRHYGVIQSTTRVLDVGCGTGSILRRFIEYGADPQHLSGIDLLPSRIERARRCNPVIDWRVGNAHELPYPDSSFEIVMACVVLSSILSDSMRRRVADELWRVCAPTGLILIHDFMYSNPRNAAVKGVGVRDMQRLFARPHVNFQIQRMTLAPPLSRRIAPRARWLAETLERLRFLDTHFLITIYLS